jgi:Mitochondrial carrier protein
MSKRPAVASKKAMLSPALSSAPVNATTSRLISESAVIGNAAVAIDDEPPPPPSTLPPPPLKNRIAADHLRESLMHQNDYVGHGYRPKRTRITRGGLLVKRCSSNNSKSSDKEAASSSSSSPILPGTPGYSLRVGIAGGIAGATGTALLYPIDCAKTMRQSNPGMNKSVRQALWSLCWEKGKGWHVQRAYKGLIPATLGAIPSSALYFGAYETMKNLIQKSCPNADRTTSRGRLWVHALSAVSGNVLSSAVFVPKEVIKQCMQFDGANTIWSICKSRGINGLYSGYCATLMRNIPSAILRFTLYEEIKYRWHTSSSSSSSTNEYGDSDTGGFNLKLFAAGALAGAVASGFSTFGADLEYYHYSLLFFSTYTPSFFVFMLASHSDTD